MDIHLKHRIHNTEMRRSKPQWPNVKFVKEAGLEEGRAFSEVPLKKEGQSENIVSSTIVWLICLMFLTPCFLRSISFPYIYGPDT